MKSKGEHYYLVRLCQNPQCRALWEVELDVVCGLTKATLQPWCISQGQNNLCPPTWDRKGWEPVGEWHVAESSCDVRVGPGSVSLLSHIDAGGRREPGTCLVSPQLLHPPGDLWLSFFKGALANLPSSRECEPTLILAELWLCLFKFLFYF